MPYFVYLVRPPREPELVESFDAYRAARERVRSLRASAGSRPGTSARLVFAPDDARARRLLSEKRVPPALGEDA